MLAEERGGRDCSRDRRGRPLRVPRALLGTGDTASPPSSRGLQQLPPGPRLVRWARERRRAGGRSSPVPAPAGRAPRPPRARARAPSRRRRPGREQRTPPAERAGPGESAAGLPGDRPETPEAGGVLSGWRGQARQSGVPGAQVPFGGTAQTHSQAPTGYHWGLGERGRLWPPRGVPSWETELRGEAGPASNSSRFRVGRCTVRTVTGKDQPPPWAWQRIP